MSGNNVLPDRPLKALIAGAGVAGLEALLELRALAGDRVELELLAPDDNFSFRPLAVAEPFGGHVAEVPLAPLLAECGAAHHRGLLAKADTAARVVTTQDGAELAYDALLVAPGAKPVVAVPGALSFGDRTERESFAELLGLLGRRGHRRIAFVVPKRATWSIAAYELALLTAGERDVRQLRGVEILLVTHEADPLMLFGDAASALVRGRLSEARIELLVEREATELRDGSLVFAAGDSLEVDHAVALPGLEVPEMPGLPQRAGGFLKTDVQMHVFGLESVWAAGDATDFPIKQGGLAAQQADVAARGIAARAGAHVAIKPFSPVLRGILITGGTPQFMRAELRRDAPGEASSGQPLWWPPSKIAGKRLGPYLSRVLTGKTSAPELLDLGVSEDPAQAEAEQARAVELVLSAAEADALREDFASALWWLALAEQLDLVLPQTYITRRATWQREVEDDAELDPAAIRIEPALVNAAAAISDLQRRIGWLRETERDEGGAMEARLARFDAGLADLVLLSKQTGILRPHG